MSFPSITIWRLLKNPSGCVCYHLHRLKPNLIASQISPHVFFSLFDKYSVKHFIASAAWQYRRVPGAAPGG